MGKSSPGDKENWPIQRGICKLMRGPMGPLSKFRNRSLLVALSGGIMLRSHLERGPAEFIEMKIGASSNSSPGFGRALHGSHIQIGRLVYIFKTEIGPSPSDLWRTPAGCRPNALPICRILSSARRLRGGAGPG